MRKKRVDVDTLVKMGLYDEDNPEKFYEFDERISFAYTTCWLAGQGEAPLEVRFFFDDNEEYKIRAKGNWISTRLHTLEGFHDYMCADPRIIAMYIEAAWLVRYFYKVRDMKTLGDLITKGNRITREENPLFTKEGALEWMEKNRFIGKNSVQRQARAIGFYEYNQRGYLPYTEEGFHGWDIYNGDPELYYLSPAGQYVYDMLIDYKRELMVLERKKAALAKKWRGKSDKELLQEYERLEKIDQEQAEFFYELFSAGIERAEEEKEEEFYKLHPEARPKLEDLFASNKTLREK